MPAARGTKWAWAHSLFSRRPGGSSLPDDLRGLGYEVGETKRKIAQERVQLLTIVSS
jgi:hypothetical protein